VKTEGDVLTNVTRLLADLDIPYMLTGSLASSVHGRPRTTHDADVVIDPSPAALEELVAGLQAAGFYVDPGVARDALRMRRQFNAIASDAAFKVDLIVRRDRPFSIEEFRRRRPARVGNEDVALATPEDTILSKLEWAKKGGSERQLEDAAGIVAVQGDALDRGYIGRWAAVLGVVDEWRRVADSELG
jgi:hypothetical protein